MNRVIQTVPSGVAATLMAVIAYRAAGQTLASVDWAMIAVFAGVVTARAATVTHRSSRAVISCMFSYVLEWSVFDLLRRLHLLSERDVHALRRRSKTRFMKDLS
jgi:hypothetical protein